MKNNSVFIFLLATICLLSCSDNKDPENRPAQVETLESDQISDITAVCKGRITDKGTGTISQYGIELNDGKVYEKHPRTISSGDNFGVEFVGLTPERTYRYRAYIDDGTVQYGEEKSFTTLSAFIYTATVDPASITSNSAVVSFTGVNTLKEWGFHYSETEATVSGPLKKEFLKADILLSGLKMDMEYHLLPYVKDKGGRITYLEKIRFKTSKYNLNRKDIHIRDPFIHVDRENKKYYMYANDNPRIKVYESENLEQWADLGAAFTATPDFWGINDFWAPDMYAYKGKYYLFVTFSGTVAKRGTSVLISDSPKGPFTPLENRSLTPDNWMCLDGALYVDDNNVPWILYCHEWLEVGDGEIVIQKLSPDLRTTDGEPFVLFQASEAPWVRSICSDKKCYVTDAPFIHKLENGVLVMLWSSNRKDGKYTIGQAVSESRNVLGPWVQLPSTLNDDDGGHAMLFRDLQGKLKISYHAPNSYTERCIIRNVHINNENRIILE